MISLGSMLRELANAQGLVMPLDSRKEAVQ